MSAELSVSQDEKTIRREEIKVVTASSVASVFEWFDFFLYGTLAVVISRNFFAGVDEATGFTLTLLAFAAGFAVRPFGAIVFGYIGDLWGRKNTFIITLLLMGGATFGVGLLPTYDEIGVLAPWLLIVMRLLQGLSVGGVYGGSAIYVAEHAPAGRRGFYTSWIQTSATVALALTLSVVFGARTILGETAFAEWGWRIPFLLSVILLALTVWIQRTLSESPVYLRMKAEGKSSTRPLSEAFGNWANVKIVLIALFGAIVGMTVIWYSAQFYTLFFLERVLKVDGAIANLLVGAALLLATPLFVFFGWLSDKVGRKPLILLACLLTAVTYFPLFKGLTAAVNPDLARAVEEVPVVVVADPKECSLQFDPVGGKTFSTSCDIVRSFLTRAGIPYETEQAAPGDMAVLKVGPHSLASFSGDESRAEKLRQDRAAWEKTAAALVASVGYPLKAETSKIHIPAALLILTLLMGYAAMAYGPIAALLVELFPARIRYTSMSLPYHLGVGWVGGFLPASAFAIVASTGNIYSGLWYPVCFAALTLVIGLIFLPNKRNVDINE